VLFFIQKGYGGISMDKETFTKMLMDSTISGRTVFEALLQYLKTAKASDPVAEEEFSRLVAEQRPKVWKKFIEYVTGGHEYCCGPNAIRDDDGCLTKAHKTILMCCHRIKWYLKFGE